MSLAAVTAAGVGAATAPSATSGGTRSGSRFHTVTCQPCSSRRRVMAVPIRPSPMNPSRGFAAVAAIACLLCSGRIQAQA